MKLKTFIISALITLLAAILLNNSALAYKPYEFPGVGSYDKWTEANVYYNKGNGLSVNSEKKAMYKKAIEIYPYDANYWENYSLVCSDVNEKIQCCLKAASLNPDDCAGYQGAGWEYQKLGEYQKAIECDKKAIAIDPGNLTVYNNLADCYDHFKQYEASALLYKSGYDKTKNPDFAFNAGLYYRKSNNLQQALDSFKIYLNANPDNKKCIKNISEIKLKLGIN